MYDKMGNVKDKLIKILIMMLIAGVPAFAGVADGAGIPRDDVPPRYGVAKFPNGSEISVKLPIGWTLGGCENCFKALNGIVLKLKMERAGGLAPCLWLNLAAPYIDAPGDRGARVDAIPLVVNKSTGADVVACRGRIVSPKYRLASYRMLANAGDDMLYSIETETIYWDGEITDRSLAGFEQQFTELAESVIIKERAAEKRAAKEAAKKKPGEKKKPRTTAAAKTPKSSNLISGDDLKSRAAVEKEKSLEDKLLSAAGRDANGEKISRRPNFKAIKESLKNAPKQMERPEQLLAADRLRLRGKLAEAKEAYTALMSTRRYDAALGLGDVAMSQGDLETARKQYMLAMKLEPNLPHAYNGLGAVAMSKDNDAAALKYFEQSLQMDRNNPSALVNLGWMALKKLRTIDAETFFMKALAMKPDLDVAAGAVNGLTAVSFNYGDYEAALNWNRSFLNIFPEYPEARANMVVAHMNMGNGEGAEAEARKLEEVSDRIPPVVILAGRAYLMNKKPGVAADRLCRYTDPARAQYIPEAIPDCVNALEQIAKGPEALEILKKSATPKLVTPGIAIMLSERLSADGEYAEAMNILNMATKKFPENPVIESAQEETMEKANPR